MTTPDTTESSSKSRCSNCGAAVEDRYCGACGQAAGAKDRISDLVWEWIVTTYAPNGLLFGTLKQLILSPADLTRDWWEYRRAGRMSPVRTLLTVIFLGSLLAWAQSLIYRDTHESAGLIISAFTYQTAIVASLVIVALLPKLMSGHLRRTTYEYATFALYESAFLALVAWAALLLVVLSGILPGLELIPFGLAPSLLPLIAVGVAIHAIRHLKAAFQMSWPGAFVRAIILGVAIMVASLIATFLLTITGISELWSPAAAFSGEPLPTFQKVPSAV